MNVCLTSSVQNGLDEEKTLALFDVPRALGCVLVESAILWQVYAFKAIRKIIP